MKIYIVSEQNRHDEWEVKAAFQSKADADKYSRLLEISHVEEAELHDGFPTVTTELTLTASIRANGDVFEQFEMEKMADGETAVVKASTRLSFERKDPETFTLFQRPQYDESKPIVKVHVSGFDSDKVQKEFARRIEAAQKDPLRVTVDKL